MALGDKGTLFVGTMGAGNVYAVHNDGTKAPASIPSRAGSTSPTASR